MKAISELPTCGAPISTVGAFWHSGRGLALANCHRPAANLDQKVGHLVDVGEVSDHSLPRHAAICEALVVAD